MDLEILEKIKLLEIENKELLQQIQIYDCCTISVIKEINYLKYKLEQNNIMY